MLFRGSNQVQKPAAVSDPTANAERSQPPPRHRSRRTSSQRRGLPGRRRYRPAEGRCRRECYDRGVLHFANRTGVYLAGACAFLINSYTVSLFGQLERGDWCGHARPLQAIGPEPVHRRPE